LTLRPPERQDGLFDVRPGGRRRAAPGGAGLMIDRNECTGERDGNEHEAHVSAEQTPATQQTRLSGPHEDQGRARRAVAPSCQGPSPPRHDDPALRFPLRRSVDRCRQPDPRRRRSPEPVMKRSPTRQSLTFGRSHRLLRRADFGKVYESGRKAHGRFVTLFALRRPDADEAAPAPWRLGLTATRKTGGAVQRNRQRRRIREFFRLRQRAFRRDGISWSIRRGPERQATSRFGERPDRGIEAIGHRSPGNERFAEGTSASGGRGRRPTTLRHDDDPNAPPVPAPLLASLAFAHAAADVPFLPLLFDVRRRGARTPFACRGRCG
jgi:ribonuclease P protein component